MKDDSNKYNDPEALKKMIKAVNEALSSGAAQELSDAIQGKPANNQLANTRLDRTTNRTQ